MVHIDVKAKTLDDIFEPYDASQLQNRKLNSYFVEYLVQNVDKEIVGSIEIIGLETKPNNLEDIINQALIKTHENLLVSINQHNRETVRSSFIALIILIFFILVNEAITYFNLPSFVSTLNVSFAVILGWVALWRAGEMFLFELRDLKIRSKKLKFLTKAKVIIK